ncbi:MAG: DUF58 domain-containing protein, partial [Gemmatimonadetes bacterium]|nr:DUF58 domain-containing protein [Gemmatimonadota bacterium]
MSPVSVRRLLRVAWAALTRVAPEPRLVRAVAAASLLWFIPGDAGRMLALGVLLALVLAALVDWLLLPPAAALTITRQVPATLGAGDDETGAYRVQSGTTRALTVTLADRLPEVIEGGVGRTTFSLAALGHAEVPFQVLGLKRGRFALGPVGAKVTTSLALMGARVVVEPGDHVDVLPSVRGVKRFRWLAMQHRLDAIGVRALKRRGEGQSFAGLRDYALGDDPRHMDWKATGRHGKPIVREFTIERSQSVLTVIDAGRGMTQVAGKLTRFEHALTSALILTDVAATAGDRVGTLVFDDAVRRFIPADRARGALMAVRDAFTPLQPSLAEPDYAQAFRFLAAHQRKRALVVLFTDVLDVRSSRALLAHVARSTSRHLALVVALRNDAMFAAADGQAFTYDATEGAPDPRTPLYTRAAAEELVQARAEALERMRRAGAVVLDM